MGYDRSATALPLLLRFEEFDGFVVRYRLPTVDALHAVIEVDDFTPITGLSVEVVKRCRPLVHQFAGLLVDWTLEANGVPVPCTAAVFLALDSVFQMQMAMTWARVSAGLPQYVPAVIEDEDDESEFDEGSIPMETLAS